MTGCYGFQLNNGKILWIKKEDVKGIRLWELSLCFDAQIRGYERG